MSKKSPDFFKYASFFLTFSSFLMINLNMRAIPLLPKDEIWKMDIIRLGNFFCFLALNISIKLSFGFTLDAPVKYFLKNTFVLTNLLLHNLLAMTEKACKRSEKLAGALLLKALDEFQKLPGIKSDHLKEEMQDFFEKNISGGLFDTRSHHAALLEKFNHLVLKIS